MASPFASLHSRGCEYDVFVNHRGIDTRRGIASYLYDALVQLKIKTFLDDQPERGEEIYQYHINAIKTSRISVIIFSENYACSAWCLDELVMILDCKRKYGHTIMPVFYHVDPSDVQNQWGRFGEAFAKHEERFKDRIDKVERWRAALKEVANLTGWHSQGPESILVEKIVRDILGKLNYRSSIVGIEESSSTSIVEEDQQLGINNLDMLQNSTRTQASSSQFHSLAEVTTVLREGGQISPNLIFAIDFSNINVWKGTIDVSDGAMSFNNQNLHVIGDTPNPYEKVISIIGDTLAPCHEDNIVPCFGLGFCDGLTSYAPVIEAAIDIVERSGREYHVLVIIANGKGTRSVDINYEGPSPHEEETIRSIITARSYPLSIVLVGVGDGPWEDMTNLISKIPVDANDNFQFIRFTDIMSKDASDSEKEAEFAFAALKRIPFQYKVAIERGTIGHVMERAEEIVMLPPVREPCHAPLDCESIKNIKNKVCPICLTNGRDMAFGCGHLTCRVCASRLYNCPICRQLICMRLSLLN